MRAFLAFLLVLPLAMASARVQDDKTPKNMRPAALSCTADKAVWSYSYQAFEPQNIGMTGWKDHSAAQARTRTWSCDVNGNLLVVRFFQTHPVNRCSAVGNVFTSAWVNGVKLFTREDAGEAPQCIGDTELHSVMLQDDGSVEICRLEWKEPLADEPVRKCERKSSRQLEKIGRDANFVAPGGVTPWNYELHYGKPEFCGKYTGRLTLVSWIDLNAVDPAFAELAIPGTEKWMNAEVDVAFDDSPDNTSAPLSAEFDIDNDGVIDSVMLYGVRKKEGLVMAELRWQRRGAAGKHSVAGEIGSDRNAAGLLSQRDSTYSAQVVRPILIAGRAYIYARLHQAFLSQDDGEDLFVTDNFPGVARGLIELHPDGTSTLVCGWGPKPHPEEFL